MTTRQAAQISAAFEEYLERKAEPAKDSGLAFTFACGFIAGRKITQQKVEELIAKVEDTLLHCPQLQNSRQGFELLEAVKALKNEAKS